MTYQISANEFIEAQTRQMEREFKSSRPKPRNKAMGFKGEGKRARFGQASRRASTVNK